MFSLLRCRSSRWRRLDPMATLAEIRSHHLLPHRPDGSPCPPDGHVKIPQWPYEGQFFQTGPYVALPLVLEQPIERLIERLVEHRPDYLLAYPSTMEEMAFASPNRSPCDSLRALLAVAGQLTTPMRRR